MNVKKYIKAYQVIPRTFPLNMAMTIRTGPFTCQGVEDYFLVINNDLYFKHLLKIKNLLNIIFIIFFKKPSTAKHNENCNGNKVIKKKSFTIYFKLYF